MKYFLLPLAFMLSYFSYSQQDITIGKTFSLHSEILDEDRLLDIYLPKNYQEGSKKYPVLYLLDSYYNFTQAVGTVDYLILNKLIPEMIIVGVRNTRRIRDLTPESFELDQRNKDRLPNRGGADDFLSFLETELIPYIEEQYRAAPYKVLVGHSLGGLLNTYCFYKKPELFEAHITISPSLWYKNILFETSLDSALKDHRDIHSVFYLTIANEGGTMLGNTYKLAGKFISYIKQNQDVDLRFKFEPMFEQSHGSVGMPSLYNGLPFIFEPIHYDVPKGKEDIIAQGGTEEALKKLQLYFEDLSKKYGFQVNDEKAMTNLGYSLLNESEFSEDAIEVFKLNLQNHPESFDAYSNLGAAYEKTGDLKLAKENYEKALNLVKTTGDPEWEFYQTDLNRVNSK